LPVSLTPHSILVSEEGGEGLIEDRKRKSGFFSSLCFSFFHFFPPFIYCSPSRSQLHFLPDAGRRLKAFSLTKCAHLKDERHNKQLLSSLADGFVNLKKINFPLQMAIRL